MAGEEEIYLTKIARPADAGISSIHALHILYKYVSGPKIYQWGLYGIWRERIRGMIGQRYIILSSYYVCGAYYVL